MLKNGEIEDYKESVIHDEKRRTMERKHLSPHQLQAETILANRYQIDGVLGEGGFGITYRGRDLNLEFEVAIKEYYPSGLANRNHTHSRDVVPNVGKSEAIFEKGKKSFLREARVLARFVGEPGIVNVRDFFIENNTAYIVMDYLDGITLKEWLGQNNKISVNQTLGLMKPIMDALLRIHGEGLIHRDISPDNIMVMKDGSIKLLDFGAARDVSGLDEKSLSVMLKPGYAPEEQYRSKGKQGPWTDIYALSATIYKCITGITPEESIERIFDDKVKKPSELGIDIDKKQERALMKGMAILQKDRFQFIRELKEGLFGDVNKNLTVDEKVKSKSEVKDSITNEMDPNLTVYIGDEATSTNANTLEESVKERNSLEVTSYVGVASTDLIRESQHKTSVEREPVAPSGTQEESKTVGSKDVENSKNKKSAYFIRLFAIGLGGIALCVLFFAAPLAHEVRDYTRVATGWQMLSETGTIRGMAFEQEFPVVMFILIPLALGILSIGALLSRRNLSHALHIIAVGGALIQIGFMFLMTRNSGFMQGVEPVFTIYIWLILFVYVGIGISAGLNTRPEFSLFFKKIKIEKGNRIKHAIAIAGAAMIILLFFLAPYFEGRVPAKHTATWWDVANYGPVVWRLSVYAIVLIPVAIILLSILSLQKPLDRLSKIQMAMAKIGLAICLMDMVYTTMSDFEVTLRITGFGWLMLIIYVGIVHTLLAIKKNQK